MRENTVPWREDLHPEVGIYREGAAEGWRAYVPGEPWKSFTDSKYGGREAALAAASRYRRSRARSLGIVSKGWWLGPDRAGGVTRVVDRYGNASYRATLCFQGVDKSASFSVGKWGERGAKWEAEAALEQMRRDLRRICRQIAKELGYGRRAA
jgi:hypothetical protein